MYLLQQQTSAINGQSVTTSDSDENRLRESATESSPRVHVNNDLPEYDQSDHP